MAEYGFDLVENWESVGIRRLWVLVKNLSPDSALYAGEGRWTRQDELLASLIEVVDAWARNIFVAQGGKVRGDPIQVTRPEAPKPKKKITTDTREIAAWFAANSQAGRR